MKEIILKIIENKLSSYIETNIEENGKIKIRGKLKLASEIADIVKAFAEWKDERLSNDKIIYHNGFYFYAKKYTHDDLFEFWYNEIRTKL